MKASLSIAILALIGKISAVELQNENLLSTVTNSIAASKVSEQESLD